MTEVYATGGAVISHEFQTLLTLLTSSRMKLGFSLSTVRNTVRQL